MLKNTKLICLVLGAAIGQGSLLTLSFLLLYFNVENVGEITTAIGLSATVALVIDWGGQVTQRQYRTVLGEEFGYLLFFLVRLIPFCGLLAVLLALWLFAEEFVEYYSFIYNFILFSSFGYFALTLSFAGFLDTDNTRYYYALFSGINYLLLLILFLASCYLEFSFSPKAAGYVNSLGMIILSSFSISMIMDSGLGSLEKCRKGMVVKFVISGGVVTLSQIPGQIMSRTISVLLLGVNDVLAGQYNFLKSMSGVFNQVVTLARRAFYRQAYDRVRARTNQLFSFSSQYESVLIGGIFSLLLALALFPVSVLLNLDWYLPIILMLHSIVWMFVSSCFYKDQLLGVNYRQLYHSSLTVVVAILSFFIYGRFSVSSALFVEAFASLFVFLVVVILGSNFARGRLS